jgi:hypothetical protein
LGIKNRDAREEERRRGLISRSPREEERAIDTVVQCPATPGRRRGAAGLAIITPGRRRGAMHSLRSVLPGSGDKGGDIREEERCHRYLQSTQGGGEGRLI